MSCSRAHIFEALQTGSSCPSVAHVHPILLETVISSLTADQTSDKQEIIKKYSNKNHKKVQEKILQESKIGLDDVLVKNYCTVKVCIGRFLRDYEN